MHSMRIALSGVLACWVLVLSGQGFNRRYDAFGQGNLQDGWDIEPNLGGYLVLGGSYEPDTVFLDSVMLVGTYTAILSQIDENGNLLWQRRTKVPWHAVYLGWTNCCDTVHGGGFIAGGSIEDTASNISARLARYSPGGDTLWTRSCGSPQHFWSGLQAKQSSDGGFLLCGYTDSTGYQDGFVIRTDSDGNEQWRQTYGWAVPVYIDGLLSIHENGNGVLYMSGSRFTSAEEDQHWVQRTDSNGELIWRVSWGGPYKEGSTGLIVLSDGYPLVIGGSAYGPEYAEMRPYMAKLDTIDGSIIWEREYGEMMYGTQFFAAKEVPNGDLIACGRTYVNSNSHGLLVRTTSTGDSVWFKAYIYQDSVVSTGEGRFHDVLPTPDGGFIAAGYALPTVGYSQDAWVVKVDSLGCIVPGCDGVGVREVVTNLQNALTLAPNPAHGQVRVQVALPPSLRGKSDLKLTLVNASGQVALVQPAHEGDNTLPLGALSSGVYYVHLSSSITWFSGTKLIIE